VLASAPVTSLLSKESENLCQSLPSLDKNKVDKFFTEETGETTRRFTVTVIDLKKYAAKKRLEITHSAPSLVSQKSLPTYLKPPAAVRRSSSCREVPPEDLEFRRRAASKRVWKTTHLLKSRRKTASVSSDSASDPYPLLPPPPIESYEKNPKIDKKRKTKTGGMFNRFKSNKTKSSSLKVKINDGPVEPPEESPAPNQSKKKVGRIFSFRNRSSSFGSKTTHSTSDDQVRQRTKTEIHSLTNPNETANTKPLTPCEARQKRSSKILELSERLADDATNASRQTPSPVPIKKGIVNRLSKRFSRHDKDKDDKKTSPSSASPKNEYFLSAKSRFESRANSMSKVHSLGRNSKLAS